MNWLRPLASALLIALIAGCTITTEGVQNFEVPLDQIFPPSKAVASYRQIEKPVKYTDEQAEAQLGSAQQFSTLKRWGNLSTLGAEYGIPERPPKARVTVTELGSKHNAYGAYTNLRPGLLDESCYVKIGVHGTVENGRLLFVQDRFLIVVRDLSGATDPERRTMLINFGRVISERIPRDITDINLVSYLPFENRVPATERLDKDDPLGLGFFKSGGVTALYRIENRECKVYLVEVQTHMERNGLLKTVKTAMEKEGPTSELNIGEEGCQGRLFKSQAMLAGRELVLYGCYGTMTEKELRNVMSGIDRRVKPYRPPQFKEKEKEKEEEKKGPGGGPG